MKQLAKRRIKQGMHRGFSLIRQSSAYRWARWRHPILRYVIAVFLAIFGLISLVTPFPGGTIMLVFALVLVMPLRRVRALVRRTAARLQISKWYGRWLAYWYGRDG